MFTTHIPSNTIVAVSSGIDSIAASFLLNRKFGIKKIYHFNHNCQPINEDMEAAVKQYAIDFGLELILAHSDGVMSSEAEYRKARLNAIFEGNTNMVLATAHHLDDVVESHLLNVFRGHAEYWPIPLITDFGNNNQIIHPFLLYTKKQFKHIVEKYNLQKYVVEDPTNIISKGSRRNFIRNEIVPLLEEHKIGMQKIWRKKILKTLCDERKFGVY